MTFVCLWSRRWSTAGAPLLADLASALLEVAPRVAVGEAGVVWVDGRGLPAARLAWRLLEILGEPGPAEVRAGVAAVPVAAELAARTGDAPVTLVDAGRERASLAPLGLELLRPDRRLLSLLEGVGVRTCGALAALPREGVEVRFGAEGVRLWRLARADDPRRLFAPMPRERPHASMDFVDHAIGEGERLLFLVNALLGSVCAKLRERGERAGQMTLALTLSDGRVVEEGVRVARATGEQAAWLRRMRAVLDGLRLPDSVAGVSLRVEAAEPATATQGDMFDRGFATAGPAEEAIARLVDGQGPVLVEPEPTGHPLAERRTLWRPRPPRAAVEAGAEPGAVPPPALTLQLLREPRPVAVRVRLRRDVVVPAAYLDRDRWREVVEVAGPDRVAGGAWEDAPWQRDYFRCVTGGGTLVWLFRDAAESWFLHGYWD